MDLIIYEKDRTPEVIIYLMSDTLASADNNYDGYSKVYVKIDKRFLPH